MTRGKAKQEFKARRRPDLPFDPPVADGADLFRGPEITIARSTISGLKREGLSATSLSIESCVLNRVALPDSTFATITLRDVRLVGCDLANVKTRALTALRVELLDCRMTGFRVEEPAECHDVLISRGLQSYSQFAYAASSPRSSTSAISRMPTSSAPIFKAASSVAATCTMRT
jgi:hypothetical protein